MEAARTSETLVNFYQTTGRYNPEDSHQSTKSLELDNLLCEQGTKSLELDNLLCEQSAMPPSEPEKLLCEKSKTFLTTEFNRRGNNMFHVLNNRRKLSVVELASKIPHSVIMLTEHFHSTFILRVSSSKQSYSITH
jgi:hypothetical protein